MELFENFLPYPELFLLLVVGQAFVAAIAHRFKSDSSLWDVFHYAMLSALPVYVVTGSMVLSLAQSLAMFVARYLWLRQALDDNRFFYMAFLLNVMWVSLLAAEVPFVME